MSKKEPPKLKLSERKQPNKNIMKEDGPSTDSLKTNCFPEPYELVYKAPSKERKYKALSIVNPEKQKMIFKFKCNNRKNFTVHTVYGYVLPLCATAIMITCKSLDKNSCAPQHRITIVVAHKTDDMPANDASKCWDATKPWYPKKTQSINVAIRYDMDNGQIIGGFTEAERVRMKNEQMDKYKLIGGRQQAKKLHDQAANECLNKNMKDVDREQAKKDIAADANKEESEIRKARDKRTPAASNKPSKASKKSDKQKVQPLPVPVVKKKDSDLENKHNFEDAKAPESDGKATTVRLDDPTCDDHTDETKDKSTSVNAAIGPDEIIIQNKKYKKIKVPPNPWFEQCRQKQ